MKLLLHVLSYPYIKYVLVVQENNLILGYWDGSFEYQQHMF